MPFHVKQLGGATCAPQWKEGSRTLRLNRDITHLRAEILARIEQPKTGLETAVGTTTTAEIMFATASLDLTATKNGYNYVQLFSPPAGENDNGHSSTSLDSGVALEGAYEGQTTAAVRLMGQLVLRLAWLEAGEASLAENGHGEKRGHAVFLVVRGASGLAKADL